MKASKVAYKPVGLALGAASGMLAGAAFKQAWKLLGHDDDAPDATDQGRSWQEILLAAALLERSSPWSRPPSTGQAPLGHLTGTWPG